MVLLQEPIKSTVETCISRSDDEYAKGNLVESIKLLEDAWRALGESPYIYDESYHIAKFLIDTLIEVDDFANARSWAGELSRCDLERIDDGDREWMAGKVEFLDGKHGQALEFFIIANEKSDGRCFEDEDSKYIEFFSSHSS